MKPRRGQPTVFSRLILLFIIIAGLFFAARYAFESTPWGKELQLQLLQQVEQAEKEQEAGEEIIIEEEAAEPVQQAPNAELPGEPEQEPEEVQTEGAAEQPRSI